MSGCAARAGAAIAACVLLFAYGCSSTHRPAPVSERGQPGASGRPLPKPTQAAPASSAVLAAPVRSADPRPEYYVVRKGDTLYSIALDLGLDYKEIAEWNNLANPNVIAIGQPLRLRPPASGVVTAPLRMSPSLEGVPAAVAPRPAADSNPAAAPAAPASEAGVVSQPRAVKLPYSDQAYAQLRAGPQAKPAVSAGTSKVEPRPDDRSTAGVDDDAVDWGWPVGGKLVSTFNENTNLKGVGIAGRLGQTVSASAPGKVLYSGDGIRGYGKLVIVKHNNTYISVYGHNSQLLVKEGQSVAKGQKIAEMGNTDSDQVKLHFEIRRFGKPIDPLKLLPPENRS